MGGRQAAQKPADKLVPAETSCPGLDGPGEPGGAGQRGFERRAGAARLVTHHEVPFFVAVEGFARVLAPVVVAHHRGRFIGGSWASPPSSWRWRPRNHSDRPGDQRIQVRSRCHSGVFAGWQVCGGCAGPRRLSDDAVQCRHLRPPRERSCAMPRQRRWEPNKRLVHERERRGWSQDDAAREAERVAGGLGLPDLVFTGAQFGRWERGECRPRPPLRRVVCELYDASAEALGLLDQGDGAANRRDLLRNAVVLGAAAVVSPAWRREESAGAAVEPAEVASIRDALMNYDGIWEDEVANLVDLRKPQPPSAAGMASSPGGGLSAARRATAPRPDRRPARRAPTRQRPPASGEQVACRDLSVCGLCHGEHRAAAILPGSRPTAASSRPNSPTIA